MAKKRQSDDLLSMLSEALQERMPSMNKSKRQKTIEVLDAIMPGLFDMLPEEDRGTKVTKAKVVKMTPVNKVQAKVRLKKTAKSRKTGMAYLDDVEPRKMLLKITLNRVKPVVRRKVEVPSNISLEHLHRVIQMAFGWSSEHLHKFMVGDDDIEPKGRGYAYDADYDAWKVSLEGGAACGWMFDKVSVRLWGKLGSYHHARKSRTLCRWRETHRTNNRTQRCVSLACEVSCGIPKATSTKRGTDENINIYTDHYDSN